MPASVSKVLGLRACATLSGSNICLLKKVCELPWRWKTMCSEAYCRYRPFCDSYGALIQVKYLYPKPSPYQHFVFETGASYIQVAGLAMHLLKQPG